MLSNTTSVRHVTEDVVVIPDNNPLFGIIGSYLSCWYSNESNGLKPLLVQNGETLTDKQEMFIDRYLINKNGSLFVLGKHLDTKYNVTEFTKNRVKLLDLRQKLLLGGKFHQSNLMDFFKKSKK